MTDDAVAQASEYQRNDSCNAPRRLFCHIILKDTILHIYYRKCQIRPRKLVNFTALSKSSCISKADTRIADVKNSVEARHEDISQDPQRACNNITIKINAR